MRNCIFNARCTEDICDKACPILVETSYLLERNGISIENTIFHTPVKEKERAMYLLHKATNGKLSVILTDDTITTSTLLTYCAICENWQGNRLHCNVYHIKFSNHLDMLQQSWSMKDAPEQLEYEQIWITTAKTLIISNLDFVQFKDFQAQTLLNIIHNRMINGLTTIIVSPKLNTLVGNGVFFQRLQAMLREAVIK